MINYTPKNFIIITLLILVLSCKRGNEHQSPVVVKVAIEPRSVELVAGASVKLTAILHHANNNILSDRPIAYVQKTCGRACGYLGYTGIEMIHPWVNELYDDVLMRRVHQTVFFYELGINFWFYSNKLAFQSSFKMDVATGYSELMKYLTTDYIQLPIPPTEAPTRKILEGLVESYKSTLDWNWSKVVETGTALGPNNQNTSSHLLFPSLLLTLQKQYGGHLSMERFLKEVDKRNPTTSIRDVIDNMAVAISVGANANLSTILIAGWRIAISKKSVDESQQRFGAPIQ